MYLIMQKLILDINYVEFIVFLKTKVWIFIRDGEGISHFLSTLLN